MTVYQHTPFASIPLNVTPETEEAKSYVWQHHFQSLYQDIRLSSYENTNLLIQLLTFYTKIH